MAKTPVDFANEILIGANFSEEGLRGADFRKADLRGATFEGADLEKANFRGANLQGALFTDAILIKAILTEANLEDVDLSRAILEKALCLRTNFSRALLFSANLGYAYLQKANLSFADLQHADFRHADLRYAKLQNADLRNTRLQHANLDNADLTGADLRYSYTLSSASTKNTIFKNANLVDAELSPRNLRDGNFSGASLAYAKTPMPRRPPTTISPARPQPRPDTSKYFSEASERSRLIKEELETPSKKVDPKDLPESDASARSKLWETNPAKYLFSYGSNDPRQLGERLGRDFVEGTGAVLAKHGRVFRGWSERWGGGVASFEKDSKRDVFGWVTKVSDADLRVLDRYEGIASGNYRRVKVTVLTQDGDTVTAIAYVSNSTQFNRPSKKYLESVVRTISTFWSDDGRSITVQDIPIV